MLQIQSLLYRMLQGYLPVNSKIIVKLILKKCIRKLLFKAYVNLCLEVTKIRNSSLTVYIYIQSFFYDHIFLLRTFAKT